MSGFGVTDSDDGPGIIGTPPPPVELTDEEQAAIDAEIDAIVKRRTR